MENKTAKYEKNTTLIVSGYLMSGYLIPFRGRITLQINCHFQITYMNSDIANFLFFGNCDTAS